MLGLFIASLGLATVVAGTTLLAPAGAVHSGATHAVRSLRFWTIYLAMFGLVGVPLTVLGLAAPVPLAIALVTSTVFSSALSHFFQDTSADIGLGRLVGTEARALLPIGEDVGKVVIQTMAERIELPARSEDGSSIERGGRVLIAFIEDGVAGVVDLDRLSRLE